jgi:hypothetical protein
MRNIVIVSVIFLSACMRPDLDPDPTDVLERGKFIQVLKDKTLAEAALNVNPKNVRGDKIDSVYNFNVYAENGVTKAQFDSTMKFYSSRPAELKELLDSVLQVLTIEKAKR